MTKFFCALLLTIVALSADRALSAEPAESTKLSIKGDRSKLDFAGQIYRYWGNASLSQADLSIQADDIVARRNADGQAQQINFSGTPVKMEQPASGKTGSLLLTARTLEYRVASDEINATTDVTLIQKQSKLQYFELTAAQAQILRSNSMNLQAKGNPLKLVISQAGREPINAQAEQLLFDEATQQFELTGGVLLSTERENIKAHKILYNANTQILQIPENKEQQSEMTQTIKGQP